ncbi:hypothetical protein V1289_008212 [Bradyrhizobium sp. AZCC 2289]
MPMRVIAKKRCRAMFEPPKKGEQATLNPNLSTRLNLLFSDQALGRRVGYCWSSELGQKAKFRSDQCMSALRPKADIAHL